VHDEFNSFHVGDAVQIEESRPISKRKHWVALGGSENAAAGRHAGATRPVDGAVG
jgi:ribosomal protein S17